MCAPSTSLVTANIWKNASLDMRKRCVKNKTVKLKCARQDIQRPAYTSKNLKGESLENTVDIGIRRERMLLEV